MRNVAENNKLIAEFMNYANIRPLTDGLLKTLYKDWNSLMPVVEKIESLGYRVEIVKHICRIKVNENIEIVFSENMLKIEATYNAVIEFIKWYNINK